MKAFLALALIGAAALPLIAQTTSSTSSTTTTTTTAAPLPAPVTTPPPPSPAMQQMLSFLTPDEKTELMSARTKAMADNPGLKTDEMGLMEKGAMLQAGTASPEDRQAFMTALVDYKSKMKAAMVKADPNVEPILAKLEMAGEKAHEQATGSQ